MHAVVIQQRTFRVAIGGIGLGDLEVISPASQFDSIVAEFLGLADQSSRN